MSQDDAYSDRSDGLQIKIDYNSSSDQEENQIQSFQSNNDDLSQLNDR